MTEFNWVDYLFIAIFVMSMLAGLARGLVKEVIVLLTWIAAVVVATLFSAKLAGLFTGSSAVQSAVSGASSSLGMNANESFSVITLGVCFVLLFVATLIIGSIINSIMSHAVEGSGISFMNRILGGFFGLARGFILAVLIAFLIQLTSLQQQPWWQQSQIVPNLQSAVRWLGDLVQPGLETLKTKMGQTLDNVKSRAGNLYNGQ